MGRHAKPIALHIAEGNPTRLTKAEIKARQENEIKLGNTNLKGVKAPEYVRLDVIAYTKWQSVMKNYKDAANQGIEVITTSDVEVLAKYCTTYSEYLSLIDRRRRIDNIDFVGLDPKLMNSLKGEKRNSMNELLRLKEILSLESAINKKHEILIKLEDRLFLNPLAKVKNVPKKEKEKPKNEMEEEFAI